MDDSRPAATRAGVEGWLKTWLGGRLGIDPREIAADESFSRLGLDSLAGAELASALGATLGRELSPLLVWERPTPAALAAHLAGEEEPAASRVPVFASSSSEDDGTVRGEPIALVGIACRFPGAPCPAALWRMLSEGRHAVREIPAERWGDAFYHPDPAHPETINTRYGAFLDRVDRFDPLFFRISPREAVQMDPQQRLMLELAWEALEDAGLPASELAGGPVGVFFGATWHDYADLHKALGAETTLHTGPGQALNIVANRVSYVFGLRGPSLVVDTACSSTLVAAQLACRSLGAGECTAALVGGVNVMLSPATGVRIAKYGGLAADGRCKTFDAGADGFGRGEGAGVVVLKKLSRALADGDRIYCLIRGGAINNDGASNGLTAPSPEAQQQVLAAAYRDAGVDPAAVDYVELHGAGTAVGDPIEAAALGAVLGAERPAERPLIVGAVKTNLAHLEAASGAAGLIKTALSLHHRRIPASLGCERLNPRLDLEGWKLELAREPRRWPEREPPLAGVSAFGWGGTNAHLVLEGWPRTEPLPALDLPRATERPPAHRSIGGQGDRRGDSPLDLGGSGIASPVFVCGPLGAQWPGMGRDLLGREPVFDAVLRRSDRAYRELGGRSLLADLARARPGDDARGRWRDMRFVPPLLFAFELAVAELWRSWGVEPAAVVGHSMGEVTAACVAGALGLEDALTLIELYTRLLPPLAERAGLALCGLPRDEVEERIAGESGLWIAGANSPRSTLVAGEHAALDRLLATLESTYRTRVPIRLVAHAPPIDEVLDELRAGLAGLAPRPTATPMVSSLTGEPVAGDELDAEHWSRHLRSMVRFDAAAATLLARGHRTFLELSPHPVLARALEESFAYHEVEAQALASSRRDTPTREVLLAARDALVDLQSHGTETQPPLRPSRPFHRHSRPFHRHSRPLLRHSRLPHRHSREGGNPGRGAVENESPVLLPLSAHTPGALAGLAERLAAEIRARAAEGSPPDLADLAWTAALRREQHAHRLALVAGSALEAAEALERWGAGELVPALAEGRAPRAGAAAPRVAFVFSGQGPQWWWAMGRDLLAGEPAFRAALARCDALIGRLAGWSPLAAINGPADAARLQRPAIAQPILCSLQIALAELWRWWGVEPALVLGHSFGEVAAAQVCGALDLESALRLALARGEAMETALGSGTMATAELSAGEAETFCADLGERVVVASINAPRLVVLAGEHEAIGEAVERLGERGVGCWQLRAKLPFHSPLVEDASRALERALAGLEPRPSRLPMISAVAAEPIAGEALGAAYWRANVRRPVRFAAAIDKAAELGCELFVEIGTQPLLAGAIAQTLAARAAAEHEPLVVTSLAPGRERAALLESLGALWARGLRPRWDRIFPRGGRLTPLPVYPFERRRYWLEGGTPRWTPSAAEPVAGDAVAEERAAVQPVVAHRAGEQGSPSARTPTGDEQEALRAIVGHVLHIAPGEVPSDVSLLALGADSLILVEVARAVARRFGVELGIRRLFEPSATVAALAARLREPRSEPAAASAHDEGDRGESEPGGAPIRFPLTPGQRELYVLSRLSPAASAAYNESLILDLEGALDPATLDAAMATIVERHEALRTVFPPGGEEQEVRPLAMLDRAARGAPRHVDLRRLAEPAAEATAHALLAALDARPFDLERGPLLRVLLLRLGERRSRLAIAAHHLVIDGLSAQVVTRELAELYAAMHDGREPRLEPPLPFRRHAAELAAAEPAPTASATDEAWQLLLGPTPPVFEPPTDHPRPPVRGYTGRQTRALLPLATVDRLAGFGEAHGASPFMTLLAAHALLLHRWSAQDDLLIGVPAVRRGDGDRPLVGHAVDLVPVRSRYRPERGFAEHLRSVREALLAARELGATTLADLVRHLGVEPDASRSPLVGAVFNLLEQPRLDAGELALRPRTPVAAAIKFELAVHVLRRTHAGRTEELELCLETRSDLWDESSARRLLGHLVTLLEALAAGDPETIAAAPVDGLPLLAPAERFQLVVEANDVPADHPRQASLGELFARRAAIRPAAVALVDEGVELTYGELLARAERLAAELQALGAGPERLVALHLERSAAMVESTLAVALAGAAYLPLDPELPAARLGFMLGDARPVVLLTRGALADRLPGDGPPRLLVDRERPAPAERPRPVRCDALSLAYAIYTSGSTGEPKAVAVTQRGVARLALGAPALRLSPGDVVAHVSNPAFDAATYEIWGALLGGARLVVLDAATMLDPSALAAALARHRVSVLSLTTAVFEQTMREAPHAFSDLELLIVGGERVAPGPIHRAALAERAPDRLLHAYGPTECTTFASIHRVDAAEATAAAPAVPIGRPIAGTAAHVVDRGLRPVPLGTPGELLLGGDGLARAYLGRPALTAERFVPDALGTKPGSRLYRTGDRVRRLADGRLDFLGRLDHQLKIRGHRVEPGEVENALELHAEIAQAAVVPGASGDHLVAYLVPRGAPRSDPPAARELRAYLAERLPEVMLPSVFVALDALPLTANGKLDRAALPAPEQDRRAQTAEPRRGLGSTEHRLAELWRELLPAGGPAPTSETSFFEAGGHSLLATRVTARIAERFGVELPVAAFFAAPTLGEQARAIEALGAAQGEPTGGIPRAPRDGGPLPLSFAQQRLYFLDRLAPESSFYNMPLAFRCTGELPFARLAAALDEIVRRHEALRTVFVEADGVPVQLVRSPRPQPLPRVDLARLPPAMREAEAERLARAEGRRRFDLARGPLQRATLLVLSRLERVLLLTHHHAISDGWSLAIVYRELGELLAAAAEERSTELPEPPLQYADFALWQRARLEREAPALVGWWKELLGTEPPRLELPTDRPRPRAQTFRGGLVDTRWPRGLLAALRETGRRRGASLAMTLEALCFALIHRLTGERRIVIGSPVAQRDRPELEQVVGFFVNTLPLLGDLAGRPSFGELLERVRAMALGVYEHHELPFERMVDELAIERDLSRNPLFQVVVALQQGPPEPQRLPGLFVELFTSGHQSTRFDLELHFHEDAEGRLVAGCGFDRDLFDRSTVERLLRQLEALASELAVAPGRPIDETRWLSAAERHQLSYEWGDGGEPRAPVGAPSADAPVHLQIAARAAATPGAIAVACAAGELSYRELDRLANGLAHRLVDRLARSIDRGERVIAVCLPRGLEQVVAWLAVLKAGAAYLPLDPAYPPRRLRSMLADARAPVITDAEGAATLGRATGGQGGATANLATITVSAETLAAGARDEPPRVAVSPLAAATLIYTSGSTGRPKGVLTSHAALARLVAWHLEAFAVTAADRGSQVSSLGFDAAAWETWPYLVAGARVELAPGEALAAHELAGWLRRRRVTVCSLTTPLTEPLLAEGPELPDLRLLLTGGDRLHAPPPAGLSFAVVNNYGPTESSVITTSGRVAPAGRTDAASPRRPPPIGRVNRGRALRVLDARFELVPIGVPGELWIGGGGLARGYLGDPRLTAERFRPFAGGPPGERLYRSGDRVRFLADGRLDFIGRLDRQLKIRGFRVEPDEVAAVLAEQPEVADAAVVARAAELTGERRLVAYVAGRPGSRDLEQRLGARLRELLPAHLLPSAIVALDALPLTAHGKLDRDRLPAPQTDGAAARPPSTPLERRLAALWSELLGVASIGTDDDFFALGGHSLLAIRLVSRLRDVLGVELPLAALFEAPTIAALARRLEDGERADDAGLPPLAPRPPGAEPPPLGFAQQRLYVLDRLRPDDRAYIMAFAYELRGGLSPRALAAALSAVVHRHEALRTRFAERGGRAVQAIDPARDQPLPVVDLERFGEAAGDVAARLARAEAGRRFDLARGPLLRTTLLRRGPDDHRLLLTLHHIVSDEHSMRVLADELEPLYAAALAGEEAGLPQLPVQVADVALWQRAWPDSLLDGQLEWWREQLGDEPPRLDLPTDRRRVGGTRGAWARLRLPPPVVRELERLAGSASATLAMALQAVFFLLLHRLSGRPRVIAGSPVAGRSAPGVDGSALERLIGFFVNLLPLPADLGRAPSFERLLDDVRRTTLGALSRQQLPFERLVEALGLPRDAASNPLVEALFAFHQAPEARRRRDGERAAGDPEQPRLRLAGLDVEGLDPALPTTRFELELHLAPAGDALAGVCAYDAALFDRTTVERWLRAYRLLCAAAAQSPTAPLAELPWLDPGERHQLIHEWGAARRAAGIDSSLIAAFARRAARRGAEIAVTGDGERLTYGELARSALAVARGLTARGVGPGAFVALSLERSPRMVVAVLGVLAAGGVYVPIEPAAPAERRETILADTEPALVLDERTLDELLAAAPGASDGDAIAELSALGQRIEPEAAAYAIFTSGSTGRPKGVVVPHAAVLRLFRTTRAALELERGDRERDTWSLFHSIAFDVSVWEIWGALLHGGRLVVVPDDVRRSPADFRRLLADERVSVLSQTPSAFAQLAVEEARAADGHPPLADLRLIVFGGEALDPAGLAGWIGRYGDLRPRLLNLYGITETTVHATLRRITARDVEAAGAAPGTPVGRPFGDLALHLLDRRGEPAPIGVTGEIHVGGPGVARGYHGRPALTAERFVPDRFASRPPGGERLYASGDLARRRADGELEYLGRADFQVQVRGHRVELGEVEAALGARPEVERAVVLAAGEPARLVAYLVAEPTPPETLRRELRRALPEYMLPAAFVFVDELPLTANGKIDRAALARLEPSSAPASVRAPATPEEEAIAEIVGDLLGLDAPRLDVAFFDLGGDSIRATQLVSRVRDALGVELPLALLFGGGGVAEIAAAVRARRGDPVPPPIERDGPEKSDDTPGAPLSYAQRRLWFLDRLDEETRAAYNLPAPMRLDGALDARRLRRALGVLIERHAALRTRFPIAGGEPYQLASSPETARAAMRLPLVDLSRLDAPARDAELSSLIAREQRMPFDLERGPLVRVHLLRLERERHALLLDLHHAIADGWSLGVLLRELVELLAANEPSLPELEVGLADHARWQRELVEGELGAAQLAWWRERLAAPRATLELPADRPRPAVQSHRGASVRLALDRELSAALRALARERGATLFMLLLAGFEVLLHRLTGERDLLVGTPIAGRDRRELEGLVGCLLNTLVLRTDLSPEDGRGEPSFGEIVARVREAALGAYAHQMLPFEKLLEELAVERDRSRTPLFQVFFNLLNFPFEGLEAEGLELAPLDLPEVEAKFDLTLYALDRGGAISLRLVYAADLFDRPRIEELAAQLEAVLRQAVEAPELPLDRFSLLTERARRVLPDPARPLDDAWRGAVHELVLARTGERPEAIALADARSRWSYGELAAASGALAGELVAGGVRRGAVVAIEARRAAELAVAVLAVLRAGAAFTLLDPDLPAARRAELVELSRAVRVLSLDEVRKGAEPTARELPRVGADDLAVVTFTSGSTGKPKGVLGRHGPLTHFLPWQAERFGLGADRVGVVSSLGHDPLQRDLFTPLCLGGVAVFPDPAQRLEPGYLARWARAQRIAVLHLTPALGRLLADGAEPGARLDDLRLVFLVGEQLTRGDAARLARLAPGARIVNLYGSTETQRAVSFHLADPAAPGPEILPLGRGMEGVQLLVRGAGGGRAGIGELGEILVRSPHLARGYLGDPALTARRFVAAPGGERWYRSGDLGRYLPDGEVAFAGRADRQLKIRGFRVEPGEIEATLETHPAVRAASVVALPEPGAGGGLRLVAFAAAGERARAPEMEAFLRSRLPAQLVPSPILVVDALPLTATGKIDRAALAARAAVAIADRGEPASRPATPTERRLAALWCELLGAAQLGGEDDFFALGGHSLLATRLLTRIARELGAALPLAALFEQPTLAGLAARIDEARASAGAGLAAAVPQAEPRPEELHLPFPLTDIQQAYWVGRQAGLELGGVASHRYLELDLERFDLERGVAVLRRLVERHAMLRAVLLPDGTQRVLERVPPYRPEIVDLRRLPEEEAAARLAAMRERFSHEIFELDRWPLFALRAARLAGGRTRLFLSLDFVVVDATSFRRLAFEAVQLYLDPRRRLAPLAFTFRDYVMALEALRGGELHRRALDYWRRRLGDLPGGPELPLERELSSLETPRFERLEHALDAERWRALRERGAASGLTGAALLLAAFASVLAAWSASPRFSLVLTLFGALPFHPDVERLVGDFTSTTLLVIETTPGESFVERARRAQQRLWSDLDHRQVSAVEVARELARGRGFAGRATSPIVFTSLLDLVDGALELPDGGEPRPSAEVVYSLSQTPQVLLDHQVAEVDGRLYLHWDVVLEAFPPGLVETMFGAYGELLERLAARPGTWSEPLGGLVPEEELARRAAVNATRADLPAGLLHEPFAERALAQPEHPAVIDRERTLTYDELLGRAAELAERLRERGARGGELVAVILPKGWRQAVATLAVLAAGAAYLPIDPALPAARRRWLLAHGGVRRALTSTELATKLSEELSEERGGALEVELLLVDPPEDGTVDGARRDPRAAAAALLATPADPGELAYTIFTSGSTGVPKGVMIEHRAARNTLADVERRFAIGPGDRVLALSSLAFDLSVFDLFALLGAGGTVVFPEPGSERDPAAWLERLRAAEVSVWNSVPALAELLALHLEASGERLPPSLRLVVLSGDWIPLALPARLRRLAPGALEVVSLGGATEASIWSIAHPIGEVEPDWRSIPYGRPLANQRFDVLDAALEPRPVGVPGSLFIAGAGLARGYWRDPARTALAFRPAAGGERRYDTGDLGRYLADGQTLEILGRRDFQVKIQGHRVELGEIETTLAAHPSVRAAVATARGEGTARHLVAYVVPAAELDDPTGTLRPFLAARLPAYLVPAVYVALDALPLSANGKIDRAALPTPGAVRAADEAAAAPRTEAERRIAELFAATLGLEHAALGAGADFFALGGSSVDAIRLVSRLRQLFAVELDAGTLFEHSTVAALAARIERAEHEAGLEWSPLVELAPGDGPPLFCVHPVGGTALCYAELARRLGGRFVGLQAPGLLPGQRPLASVEALAALHLEAIRRAQPEGPYRLAGWSMGGLVAWELARALTAAGEEVTLVALLDAGPAQSEPLRREPPATLAERLLAEAEGQDALLATDDVERLRRLVVAHAEAMLAYRPRPSDLRPLLLAASERRESEMGYPDDLGWGEHGVAVLRVEVPGTHLTMVRPPHVETLAARLREASERLERARGAFAASGEISGSDR